MTTDFEITDKELREVYELLTKEQLIEALIRKHKECRDIAKNCVIPAVISSFLSSYNDEQLEDVLKNHTITVSISDMFKAYKEGSLQAGLNNRCGFERYDFMEWLQKNYL